MDRVYFIPTKEGGFLVRKFDRLTPNQQAFVEQTKDCNPRSEEDRAKAQRLAKELLWS